MAFKKNFFNRSADEFESLPDTARQRAGTAPSGSGMGAEDWAGIGMQLYGASMQDKAAQEELDRQERDRRLALMISARDKERTAEDTERQFQQTDRAQNLSAQSVLAKQREDARGGIMHSFRKSMLKAIGA